jgi:hypothetical protein
LNGAEVANINSSVCSFTMSATYHPSSLVLSGTYKAVHGCVGESGTFTLTKGCYYPRKGLLDAIPEQKGDTIMKPNNGAHQC